MGAGSLNLSGLEAFLAVVEHGSVLGAAAALGRSRSSVRRQLADLEALLGVRLFSRTREGVTPTPAGEQMVERARGLLGDARLLVATAHQAGEAADSRIRIGLQVGYPPVLAALLSKLAVDQFPRSETEHLVAERPADLLPDRADVVLCIGEQPAAGACVELVVARIEQALLAPQAFVDQHPDLTLDELLPMLHGIWRAPTEAEPCVHLRDGGQRAVTPLVISPDETFLAAYAHVMGGPVYAPVSPPSPGQEALVPLLSDTVGRTLRARLLVPEQLVETPRVKAALDAFRNATGNTPTPYVPPRGR